MFVYFKISEKKNPSDIKIIFAQIQKQATGKFTSNFELTVD
jgi:hypothetical protein